MKVQIQHPDGSHQTLNAPGAEIRLPLSAPGVYQVQSGSGTNRLSELMAINFLAGEESNLARAVTGDWGQWETDHEIRLEYASILPYLVLFALAIMVWHLYCIARQGGRT